jgi:hypothetical protein
MSAAPSNGVRIGRRLASQSGYSLVELLVSSAILITVTGSIFSLVAPAQKTSQAQPEVADLQQRMRIGADTLFKELMMAGAGPYQGATTGSLVNFFAPILPRRTGRQNPDPVGVFRPDVITLTYVPNSYSQTSISGPMPPNSSEVKVDPQPNCPKGDELCGFDIGDSVIIFDSSGNFDTFDITQVQDSAAHLQHRGQGFNHQYERGAPVTQVVSYTFYLDRTTNQLKRYSGGGAPDVPLVDNVVDLRFDYFGDPTPPVAPKPAPGVANCLYDAMGNYLNPGQLPADHGGLAALTAALLTDGPWCGAGSNAFDVDLLRVRKLRVSLRMQVGDDQFRGRDTRFFRNPGKSEGGAKLIPDYEVAFDVTPRNLNLTR